MRKEPLPARPTGSSAASSWLPAARSFSKEARELLSIYAWLGNVRELENVMERAVILCRGDVVTVQDLPLSLREQPGVQPLSSEAFKLPPGGVTLWRSWRSSSSSRLSSG